MDRYFRIYCPSLKLSLYKPAILFLDSNVSIIVNSRRHVNIIASFGFYKIIFQYSFVLNNEKTRCKFLKTKSFWLQEPIEG